MPEMTAGSGRRVRNGIGQRLGLLVLLAASIGSSESQAMDSPKRRETKLPARGLCAHRGAMDTHPENTLSAFREAVRCGAHMIEFDVQLTRDRKLVVMHDATVDRTTNGKGRVADLTLAALKKLDAGSWKSPEHAGETIPTLSEALAVMPGNIWLNVHLYGEKELGRRAARVIARKRRLHQAFLACGAAAARGARSVSPRILICNMDRQKNPRDYVQSTIRMKAGFIQLCGAVTPDYRAFVATLKKHRVRVNYFGTDSADELRTLFEMGVDFPLVNRIHASMKVAEKLGIRPVEPTPRNARKDR